MTKAAASPWDLTALLNSAQLASGRAGAGTNRRAERHLWLVRLLEWLRHAPLPTPGSSVGASAAALTAPTPPTATPTATTADTATPMPLRRLKHLLNVLDRNPEHRANVSLLLHQFLRDVDVASLLADFGFAPRMDLWGEFRRRLKDRLLPQTPDTSDLGELFGLLFPKADDASWLLAMDGATLERLRELLLSSAPQPAPTTAANSSGPADGAERGSEFNTGSETPGDPEEAWKTPFFDAVMYLASAVRAAGFAKAMRQRMAPELLKGAPFRQLARSAERVRDLAQAGDDAALVPELHYFRALLDLCRQCATSVLAHLEEHGVSVDLVFEVDQLCERTHRIEALLQCVLSPKPGSEIVGLVADLAQTGVAQQSISALFSRHYSLLARKVAERNAETGEHYITRDRHEYRSMLRAAAGGGAVIAGTTFLKFFLVAMGLSAFWGGFWAGMNYAASFVVVQLLHWTVATKQPAMTAPAMADKLTDLSSDSAVEGFVDEVAHLLRSQFAGITGNLAVVAPLVLLVQWLSVRAAGQPLVGTADANHVLDSLTLLGPTALFAAFTGVLLFISSLLAGWVENWFVWHRLDSAIAWNPRIVARLGAARAQRWAAYWRANVSGYAANISLGMMLGLVPAVAIFFGLPIEVRHVTLSTGQLAAAVGALGWQVTMESAFWWCVAGIAATGLLNLGVSFYLAFKVALRSRGIRLADRSRIRRAIFHRLRTRPASFVIPPASPTPTA